MIDAQTGRQFSYNEFYRLACTAAGKLHELGIRRGQRIALVLDNSAEFAALYFGCLFLGAVAVPVNPALHPREVAFILVHSGAALMVCSPATKPLVDSASAGDEPHLYLLPEHEREQADTAVAWWSFEELAPAIPDWQPLDGVHEDDLFSMTFTSGTTGMPKGIVHRIRSLLDNALAFTEALDIEARNRFLHVLPMTYMAGFLNSLLCPFMAGASVVLWRAFDPSIALRFWKPVIEYSADTFWLVPTMLTTLARVDRKTEGIEYCRQHDITICVCTAPLPANTKREFEAKYGVTLFESYGLSETLITTCNTKRHPRFEGSVGRPLRGFEIRITTEDGETLPTNTNGDIWVRTPNIMAGYLNYETLQPDVVSLQDWFPTGDIGHLNVDGDLFITGRKKDLIIRGGFNISPRVVEDVLMEFEAVEGAAVVGLPHEYYGEEVVAVVRLKPGYEIDNVRPLLDALCKDKLNIVSVPTKYFGLDQFPISSTGKVQKAKLRHLLENERDEKE